MSPLRAAGPAKKKTCHRSGRLPGGRSDWAYRDFPISLAQLATAGRPLAEKKHVTAFPGLWAAGPAKKTCHRSARLAQRKEKHVTAPRGPPREKKTCHRSGLRPRRPEAVTCFIFHEKSRQHDFSNGSGGPVRYHVPPTEIYDMM